MIGNDGSRKNETVFWEKFKDVLGEAVAEREADLEEYYRNEFSDTRAACGENPMARKVIDRVKEMGLTAVLATNPFFPAVATETRMSWVGLHPTDFALVTTYENSGSCKPNLNYYREIIDKLALDPTECLMVGNDVDEDMIAETVYCALGCV